ncbi:MAG TPA: hypothetical protein DIS79_07555 [Bacteroidetes bacterium]|nr:hypothetical protein [Bacteroidota bacterium]HRK03965.1 hypothetical protein [Chlorobiota bacterium]
MDDFLVWYSSASTLWKVGVWVLGGLLVLSLIKRLVKLAILVTVLLILIFVLRAVLQSAG